MKLTIPQVWQALRMPGSPGVKCSSPFREDNSPSFSVYEYKGQSRYKDFGSPGVAGDVYDFIRLAKQAGYEQADQILKEDKLPEYKPLPEVPREERQKMWQTLLYRGDLREHWQLSKLRKLKLEGIERAVDIGLLRFLKWRNKECWAVLDSTLKCAQARPLDGSLWSEKDDAKSITLPGSVASHPVGCTTIPDNWDETFLLVEGAPDLIAAVQSTLGSGQAVCAMLGASNNFTYETAKYFKDSRVFILPHNDKPGQEAALRWRDQLNRVAEVIITKIPQRYKDYNEWISAEG